MNKFLLLQKNGIKCSKKDMNKFVQNRRLMDLIFTSAIMKLKKVNPIKLEANQSKELKEI